MRAATIRRGVALTGPARPSPTPATAVLTPTRRPLPSTSPPPELPGLAAASVWMTASTRRRWAPSTTWAEVTRNASGVMTTADPPPCARRPLRGRWLTWRLAIEGMTSSATDVTIVEYASSASVSRSRSMSSTTLFALCRDGAFGAHLAHLLESFLQLGEPLLLVLADEAHAPGQRLAAAAGHAPAHQR